MPSARRGRPLLALCALLLALTLQPVAAKERLIWLVRDLPPFTIFDGSEKGQGVIDQLLPLLIEQMPEYDHRIVRVNRARGLQMLQAGHFVCDPTLLWTAERARYVQYSVPALGALSSGLMVHKHNANRLKAFSNGSEVDLQGLLTQTPLKLGIVAERSYGTQIDDMISNLPDSALNRHYGNDATASLLQMQQLGRLQLVLGYWPEMRYLIQQHGGSPDDYRFYPIQGVKRFQFLHVGCANTTLGRAAIAHIDQLLPTLRRETLPLLYANWLDPELREDYLQQSRQFFTDP
ncbi:TIGR02285 family protein [Pseudomonas putida]|uniref:TIGR02285 family protein n=1 Tax=Pseudomonas putida TaxID=303 RepID=UPI001059C544|nr:TIGR02285 family protein [Pseudomonas putida]TDJ77737.1 TIGR02285 family protein [Pseudomonas putida]